MTSTSSPLHSEVGGGGSGQGATGTKRPFRGLALMGAPGSGKSTLLAELVDETMKLKREARIGDPAGNWPELGEWPEKRDDPRSLEQISDDWLTSIMRPRAPIRDREGRVHVREDLRPLFLVADDLDSYSGPTARGPWKRLFTTFRHYRIDWAVATRRSQDTPKVVFTSATFVYAFRHFVSTDYLREHYGPEFVDAIPEEPFKYARLDVETREIVIGDTKPRKTRTTADG